MLRNSVTKTSTWCVPGSDAGAIGGYSSARRLWPRSIVQPPLTAADKSYHTAALRAEAQRPEQQLDIAYTDKQHADPC
jgi:hypothetical protein